MGRKRHKTAKRPGDAAGATNSSVAAKHPPASAPPRTAAASNEADLSLPPWLKTWLAKYGATVAVCGLLVVLVAVVFGQTLWASFIDLDDAQYVFRNHHVRDGLSWDGIAWAFSHRYEANWHPLTWISHMLDWQLYRDWAGGHHLTSLLLHALAAMALFLALWRLTGRQGLSALVAVLFAIHPLRAESVAWIAERKDVLSGLFFALTLWAWAEYVRRRGMSTEYKVQGKKYTAASEQGREAKAPATDTCVLGPEYRAPSTGIWWYALVVVFFALGLMAKPMLVTLPFVLLLLDFWPLRRTTGVPSLAGGGGKSRLEPGLQLIVEKLPLMALTVASSR